MKRLSLAITLMLIVMTIAAACAPDNGTTGDNGGIGDGGGWLDGSPAEADHAFSAKDGALTEGVAVESAIYEEVAAPVGAEPSAAVADEQATSRLNAGEVDDNAGWDDYLLYLREYQGSDVIRVDVTERHQILVQDGAGRPVLGALVSVSVDGQQVIQLRTHADGRAFFFPGALPAADQAEMYDVRVETGAGTAELAIPAAGVQREWPVTVASAVDALPSTRLDVLFLIDATGSMGDEIAQLKDNIQSISAQIDALPSQPDVRFAMTIYRDQGDAYVSRTFDFTPDVDVFSAALAEVQADGGGDYPEDLNEGFSRAVRAPEWRIEDTVSLIFLVADAPPHLDYGQQNHYAVEMMEAATRGIKVYPIASSGLDAQGEYIFRQLAQFTGGRFIFLTYGPEGPGTTGTETEFNVEDYTVAALDDLVVRIVEEELSYQTR